MSLQGYLHIDDGQQERLADIADRYRSLHKDPQHCRPTIIINVPQPDMPSWEDMLADPLLMLKAQLDAIPRHLEIADDYLPTVQVNFGTGQVAASAGAACTGPELGCRQLIGRKVSKRDRPAHHKASVPEQISVHDGSSGSRHRGMPQSPWVRGMEIKVPSREKLCVNTTILLASSYVK